MLHHRLRAAARSAAGGGIPTDGLMLHYTMDNIIGATLVDETGNFDGTIAGATPVAGVIGQALSFDGNDYVSYAGGQQSNVFTVSLWFKTTQTTTGLLWHQPNTGGGQAPNMGRAIIISSAGIALFSRDATADLSDGSPSGYQQTTPISGYQDGAWHHLIAQQNGASLLVRIDDEVQETFTMPSELSPTLYSSAANLGRRAAVLSASPLYFVGQLDQCRYYGRILSAGEISALAADA